MKIKLDANGYIIGFASVGDIEGSIETTLTEEELRIPFIDAYKYIDGKLVKDDVKESIIIEKEKLSQLKVKEQSQTINYFKSKEFKTLSTNEKDKLLELLARQAGYIL